MVATPSTSATTPIFMTPSTASFAFSNTRTEIIERPMTTITDIKPAQDQIANYHRNGFLIVRAVFTSEEITELDAEGWRLLQRTDLIDSDNIRCRWQNCVST